LNRQSFDALPDDLRAAFYKLLRIRSQIAVQNYYSGPGYERAFSRLQESGVEIFELEEDELARWRDRVTPLKERYISQYEAEGLPARVVVADLEDLAAKYASLTNDQINDRIINSPTQGIIDL
jgi:TRAP-type C4-dicarboxylate transport system substrate-binding protein